MWSWVLHRITGVADVDAFDASIRTSEQRVESIMKSFRF